MTGAAVVRSMYVIQSARVTESSCICCCLFSLCVAADPPGHPRDCAQVPAHPGPQAGAAKGTAVDTYSSQLELAAAAPVRIAASRLAAAPGGGASWGLYCAPLPAFCPDPQQCCSILQRAFPLVKDRPVPMRLCCAGSPAHQRERPPHAAVSRTACAVRAC